jgi:putative holliday junction resolvase
MGRVLAFDVGKKRIGVAVTDPLRIIATALHTIEAREIWNYLEAYINKESVDQFVVGWPVQMNNQPSEAAVFVSTFVEKIKKLYPDKKVDLVDERFTSRIAQDTILESGIKKMKRRDKGIADRVSAVIILQSWLERDLNIKLRM